MFDVVQAARESSQQVVSENILGELNPNVFHLNNGASDFRYELLNIAGVEGKIRKEIVHTSSIGWFGGDKPFHNGFPKKLSVLRVGQSHDIAVGGGRDFCQDGGPQNGIVDLFKWGFASNHLVLQTA